MSERKTVLTKLTDSSLIERLTIDTGEALIKHINKSVDTHLFNLVLPLKRLDGEENGVYLGAYRKSDSTPILGKSSNFDDEYAKNNVVYIIKKDSGKLIRVNSEKILLDMISSHLDLEQFPKYFNVTFKELEVTKIIFGLYTKKMRYADTILSNYELSIKCPHILTNSSYIIEAELDGLVNNYGETKQKFMLQDMIFIPKYNRKGYNIPKDRTLSKDDRVEFKYRNKLVKGKIVDIRKNAGNYLDKNGKLLTNRIFYVELSTNKDQIFKFNIKDLKKLY